MTMKRKTLLTLSLGANAVLIPVVAVLGWHIAAPDSPVPEPTADAGLGTAPSTVAPPPEGAVAEVINPDLPTERVVKPEAEEASEDNFGQFLKELEELDMRVVPNRILGRLSIRALDANAQLTDEVRDLFALGEEETERLNRIFDDAAQRLRQLEIRNMEVESLSDTQAFVRIAPLGPDAQILHDELRQAVDHELGDIDGALFWDIMEGSNHQAFWSGFGEHGIELNLTVEADESGDIGMSLKSKPVTSPYPVSSNSLHPGPPEEAAQRLGYYLKRQTYLINHLPEHMRKLLGQSSPD